MKRLSWLQEAYGRHPTITDGVIAAVLFGFILIDAWIHVEDLTSYPWSPRRPTAVGVAGLALLLTAPLIWRRRFPLTVLGLVTLAFFLFKLRLNWIDATGLYPLIAHLLAILSAGSNSDHPLRNWVRAASVAAGMGWLAREVLAQSDFAVTPHTNMHVVFELLFVGILYGAFWLIGNIKQIRREKEVQFLERTAELELEREENARMAVFEERVRIARELHDVVAHHVSIMGVQAGAARRVLERQPDRAKDALSAIETASRLAVTEMQRLLGFLRQEGESDGVAPQPSIRHLSALIGQMREAGLQVEVTTEGEERTLPPSVDLSAYRVAQEALTNTLKHAGPVKVNVTVRYEDDAVEIEVLDDGRGQIDGASRNRGVGLIGMRERVSLHDGELKTGPLPGGGFLVRAKFPVSGSS